MKLYFRILSYARPLGGYAGNYFITVVISIIFSLVNFTLLIPLLNVLFGVVDEARPLLVEKPDFAISLSFVKDLFNYYFDKFYFDPITQSYDQASALLFVCGVLIVSVFISNLFKYISFRILATVRANVVKNIRKDVFSRIIDLHIGFFSSEKKGDIMSRLSNDIQEIENSVVNTLTVVLREPFALLGFFILLFTISWELTLYTLVLFPISGGIIAEITKRLRKQSRSGQETLGQIMSIVDESISGVRIIKAFTAEKYINNKFDEENNKYSGLIKSMANKRELASPLAEFMGVGVVAVLLMLGGHMVFNNKLNASEFIAYIVLFSQVLVPAKAISSSISNIQRGLVSAERIFAISDTKSEIVDKKEALDVTGFNDSIEFRNVSFSYGGEDMVLKNINLKIAKGKTIALVGPSGGGKSTLADLLPRFYDPIDGDVLLDNVSLRDLQLNKLRSLMGIVTQESILFNDSIFNNIAFGIPNVTQEDVEKAARIANAHDFILQTEAGYGTIIGDRGMKLSGGQRQRLSIARAVLKNPPILILDEATSALDSESEKLVQDALNKLMKNRTSVVIAHRLSTIIDADEIVVIQKGKIIEQGPHADLLAADGFYKKLYSSNSFELTDIDK